MIGIDIGYSSTKVFINGKCSKFPTAISYATDVGLSYGDSSVYSFEGEQFFVGDEAISGEAFNTIDYKFLHKYAPLIIYHLLKQFDGVNLARPVEIKTGLAIVDWANKEEFIKRISSFEVNGEKVELKVSLIPQGGGVYADWIHRENKDKHPENAHILDIGFNTINSIHFENGKPIRSKTNAYPTHGVISAVKPFVSYLENRFRMSFSNAEAINYFVKGKFVFNGEEVKEVEEKIKELKAQMVKRLFQSVLVNEKKVLSTSEVVIIGGGGAYLLKGVALPNNVRIIADSPEYSNVRGYML